MNNCCTLVEVSNIPGVEGDVGPSGSNGVNAFTILSFDLTLPTALANVTALIGSSIWMAVGQDIVISDGTNIGHFKVVSFPGATSVILKWMNYNGDSATGTVILANAAVSASGPIGFVAPLTVGNGGLGGTSLATNTAGIPIQFASGTFTANGATAVTVANAALTANSVVLITLKTVGGTVGAVPAIQTVTPGTGFTVKGTASDTSIYNYLIIG